MYALQAHTPSGPQPEEMIPTLAELQARVKEITGELPGWLATCPTETYIAVEHEYQLGGVWNCLDIEGSEPHIMPTPEQREAYQREHPPVGRFD